MVTILEQSRFKKSSSVSCYLLWIAGRDAMSREKGIQKEREEDLVASFVSKKVKYHKFYRFWYQKNAWNVQNDKNLISTLTESTFKQDSDRTFLDKFVLRLF